MDTSNRSIETVTRITLPIVSETSVNSQSAIKTLPVVEETVQSSTADDSGFSSIIMEPLISQITEQQIETDVIVSTIDGKEDIATKEKMK